MNNKAQFTPGPWNARRNHAETTESERINITAGSVLIAETHHAWIDWEEQEANAHLIAAAPAMYEALRKVIEHRAKEYLDNTIEPYCSLVAALAQAEGNR